MSEPEIAARFAALELADWRQFASVRLLFHPRLTVLTGANASGKTTILNLLSQHFGWSALFVSTPRRKSRTGLIEYLTGFRRTRRNLPDAPGDIIGKIRYSTDVESEIFVPDVESGASQPTFQPQY